MTTFAFKSAAASLLAVAVLMGCDGDKTSSETEDTTLDDIWVHNTYIKAANAGAEDAFGGAMATDGELMVVAAKGEDSNQLTVTNGTTASEDDSSTDAGAAYLYRKSTTGWVQEAYLKAPEATTSFGSNVAVSGTVVAISGVASSNSQDKVYVFEQTSSTWAHTATLVAQNDTTGTGCFGAGLAVSGTTIAVGHACDDSNQSTITTNASNDDSAVSSGAVYVFTKASNVWSQQAYIKSKANQVGAAFGSSVALDGDTLVVGIPQLGITDAGTFTTDEAIANAITGITDGVDSDIGGIEIFQRTGTVWAFEALVSTQITQPSSYDPASGLLGTSVAIDGDTIVAGGTYDYLNYNAVLNASTLNGKGGHVLAYIGSGAAMVVQKTNNEWQMQAYLKATNIGQSDGFGASVAISGDTIVVGAPWEDSSVNVTKNGDGVAANDNNASAAGAAYLFTRENSTWTQKAYFKGPTNAANQNFGSSVAIIDSKTIAVSSPNENGNGKTVEQSKTISVSGSVSKSGAVSVFALGPNPGLDDIAPATQPSATAGTFKSADLPTSITFTCTDEGTNSQGCANTYYTLDGSTPSAGNGTTQTYTSGSVSLNANASTTVKVYSVDKNGNTETVKTFEYTLDNAAATTTSSLAAGTYASGQTVTLTCEDAVSDCVIYYTLDGSTPVVPTASADNTSTSSNTFVYSAPITLTETTTIKYFSVDAAGNVESTQTRVYTFGTDSDFTVQAVAGGAMTVLLQKDGSVKTWGSNTFGTMGHTPGTNGDVDDTTNAIYYNSTPTTISSLTDVVSIDAGYRFIVALKSDGTVWAWGRNENGELGHTAGTASDATLENSYGPYFGFGDVDGDGFEYYNTTPTQVAGLTGIIAISAGANHALALKSDGSVYAWGDNFSGQIGQNTSSDQYETATQVKDTAGTGTLANIIAIDAADNTSYAVAADGTLYAWGGNTNLQLGLGDNTNRLLPTVSSLTGVAKVKGGYQTGMALKTNGDVYAWGENANGQLGTGGSPTESSTPIQVTAVNSIVAIESDSGASFVLTSDGTAKSWGNNIVGHLGIGTVNNASSPTALTVGNTEFVSFDVGENFAIGLDANGAVYGWGSNFYGQLGHTPGSNGDTTSGDIYNLSGVAFDAAYTNAIAAPLDVTATNNAGDMTVSWTAVSGAASYDVYWATTPGVNQLNGTKVTGVTSGTDITGLTAGTYFVTVVAVTAEGANSVGSIETFVTLAP